MMKCRKPREIKERLMEDIEMDKKESKFAGIPTSEQETVIQYSRSEDKAYIYTSDLTQMNRLDKLYEVVKIDTVNGKIVAKHYTCPKRLLSYRTNPDYKPERTVKKQVSPKVIEALKKYHDKKKASKG